MRNPVILDGRLVLDGDKLSRSGFRYLSIN